MTWGVPMLPTTGGVSLATGATGAYDAYFKTLATNLVAAGMGNSAPPTRLGVQRGILPVGRGRPAGELRRVLGVRS